MASIDGLISGMGTSDMISQLMKLEAAPQTALKNKVTVQNRAVTAYQSVNSRFSSLLSAARAVTNPDTWGSMKATSSSDAVAVTAKPGSAAGTLSFKVDKLAAAHTVTYNGSVGATTAAVTAADSIVVPLAAGGTANVPLTDKSLAGVVKAINEAAGAAYTATTVQTGPGTFTLQLTAKTTGQASSFGTPPELDAGVLGTGVATTIGIDAKLIVGTDATYEITSATNTFADVLPGVTLTASKIKTDAPVTVTLASDTDSVVGKVQALVDNANVVLNEIASQTKAKTGELAAGPLAGDSAMRKLSQEILSSVSGGAGNLGSLSQVGISVSRDGRLTFDKTKLVDALAADPAKARSYFDSYADVAHPAAAAGFNPGWDVATGLGRRLEAIGAVTSEGVILPTDSPEKAKQGFLTGLIQRRDDQIRGLNDRVTAWDQRLAVRKSNLERQWSGLEVALGKLQSQSSWLSGQLAGMSTS
jgi:flagellar hook-associated protein 2